MPGRLKCAIAIFVIAAIVAASAACQTKSPPRAIINDPTPEDDDTSPPVEQSPTPDEVWNLWHGTWQSNAFAFEAVPTPATLSPNISALGDGSLAIVSTSKTQEVVHGVSVNTQTLYLARKLAVGTWRPALALDSFGWSTQNSSLAAEATGNLHVLYSREGIPTHLTIVDNKVTSDTLQTGSTTPAPASVSLAFNSLGVLHAVFGDYGLSHQVWLNGVWQIADTRDNLRFPALTFFTKDQTDPAARLVCLQYAESGVGYTLMHFVRGDSGWVGGPVAPDIDFYEAPHALVDSTDQTNILVPSGRGLMYLVQDSSAPGGWRTEIVAGQNSEMGYQSAALTLVDGAPVAVFRDERQAKGYISFRTGGHWSTTEITGFNGGFIGLGLAVDPSKNLHVIFAGHREAP